MEDILNTLKILVTTFTPVRQRQSNRSPCFCVYVGNKTPAENEHQSDTTPFLLTRHRQKNYEALTHNSSNTYMSQKHKHVWHTFMECQTHKHSSSVDYISILKQDSKNLLTKLCLIYRVSTSSTWQGRWLVVKLTNTGNKVLKNAYKPCDRSYFVKGEELGRMLLILCVKVRFETRFNTGYSTSKALEPTHSLVWDQLHTPLCWLYWLGAANIWHTNSTNMTRVDTSACDQNSEYFNIAI